MPRERWRTNISEKACSRCGVTKLIEEFHETKTGRGLRAAHCKVCISELNKGRYAAGKARGPLIVVTEQTCRDCSVTKPAVDFGVNARQPSGLQPYCKSCMGIRSAMSKYRITRAEFDALMLQTSCAICGSTTERLVIDHNHDTGQVRARLCDDCNVGLARFKENPDFMLAAAAYVLRDANVLGVIANG